MTSQDRQDIIQLFGTIPNAMKRLGLESQINYQRARRVLLGETTESSQDDVDRINDAWRAWCRQYFLAHLLLREEYHEFVVADGEAGEARERELRDALDHRVDVIEGVDLDVERDFEEEALRTADAR